MQTAFLIGGLGTFALGFVAFIAGHVSASIMVIGALMIIIGGLFWLVVDGDEV